MNKIIFKTHNAEFTITMSAVPQKGDRLMLAGVGRQVERVCYDLDVARQESVIRDPYITVYIK